MSHYTKNTPVWNVKYSPLWKFLFRGPTKWSPDSHKCCSSTLTLLSATLEWERGQVAQRQNASKSAPAIWKPAVVNVALYVRCCASLWLTGESQHRNPRLLRESHCEWFPPRSLGSPNNTSRVLPLPSRFYERRSLACSVTQVKDAEMLERKLDKLIKTAVSCCADDKIIIVQ